MIIFREAHVFFLITWMHAGGRMGGKTRASRLLIWILSCGGVGNGQLHKAHKTYNVSRTIHPSRQKNVGAFESGEILRYSFEYWRIFHEWRPEDKMLTSSVVIC